MEARVKLNLEVPEPLRRRLKVTAARLGTTYVGLLSISLDLIERELLQVIDKGEAQASDA